VKKNCGDRYKRVKGEGFVSLVELQQQSALVGKQGGRYARKNRL
jgi:hypothetical protein